MVSLLPRGVQGSQKALTVVGQHVGPAGFFACPQTITHVKMGLQGMTCLTVPSSTLARNLMMFQPGATTATS